MERQVTTRQKKKSLPIASLIAEIDKHLDTPPEEYPSFYSQPPINVTLIKDPISPLPGYAFFQDISAIARNSTNVISQLRCAHLYPEYRDSIENTAEFRVDTNAEEFPYLEQCRLNIPSKQLSSILRNINLEVVHETSREFDRLQTEARQRVSGDSRSCNIDALLAKYSAHPLQISPPVEQTQDEQYYDLEVSGKGANPLDMETECRRTYAICAKKLVPRAAKQLNTTRSIILNNCKKVASLCAKETRRQAQRSHKLSRESVARARRLMREANTYWRKYERVEREARRKADREALEQRRMEEERREAKRQQRKLNFLITQTELYAHFVSGKKSARLKSESGMEGEQSTERDILSRLDEAAERTADPQDTYSSDTAKQTVLQSVRGALERDQERQRLCDSALQEAAGMESSETAVQPQLFQGELKSYQLKGMRWLAGLYSQGINGILADEMGLGKTIQTLALLAHLSERENIWGPFLVVSPASTLHNWQQECERFVPAFKVLPYWGNAQDRRTIRQYMSKKDLLSCSDSPFHILITSYQLAVRDCSYLHKITWQYMVLDEAQAIKSSASQRWQVLLGFKCRNRLLLTGTPIQNSMAELWALLHFIMPSLFDSHDEFKEWFSKDIESHAEGRSAALDQDQLSRLHLILKPFMLRRIKKDVEHEMAAKIEINLECELTLRQKLLYQGLKNKLSLEEIFQHCSLSRGSTATSLLNIVMQFRKVCNHPDLFDRREVTSPLVCERREYFMPTLLHRYSAEEERFSLYKRALLNLHSPRNIHYCLQESTHGVFSFLPFLGISLSQWHLLWTASHLDKLRTLRKFRFKLLLLCHYQTWLSSTHNTHILVPHLILQNRVSSIVTPHHLPSLTFTIMQYFIGHASSPSSEELEPVTSPRILVLQSPQRIVSSQISVYASSRRAELERIQCQAGRSNEMDKFILRGLLEPNKFNFEPLSSDSEPGGLYSIRPLGGWSNIAVPAKEKLITDSGKMRVLDSLLVRLKAEEHRVLIYSQMTKMIDLLEECMIYRKYRYIRLDGSSKISERRDMVADFQTKSDIFAFLLSTRAGGLGINLTAADTVVFYDSDWNPTVDQQAMDRAHRLGQTRQVTVYRLITKGTIDEKILERAREKSEIQHMVISGGQFKMDALKPKEIASLLLDSEDIENKLLAKQQERREQEERIKERKRKSKQSHSTAKRFKPETSSPQPLSRPSSPSVRTASPSLKHKSVKPSVIPLKLSFHATPPGDSRECPDSPLPLTEAIPPQDFNSDHDL